MLKGWFFLFSLKTRDTHATNFWALLVECTCRTAIHYSSQFPSWLKIIYYKFKRSYQSQMVLMNVRRRLFSCCTFPSGIRFVNDTDGSSCIFKGRAKVLTLALPLNSNCCSICKQFKKPQQKFTCSKTIQLNSLTLKEHWDMSNN